MGRSSLENTMRKADELFKQSGMSLEALGQAMGYEGDVARKAAWQFLNKTHDPRLSMLERFANAVGVPVTELFTEPKPKRSK